MDEQDIVEQVEGDFDLTSLVVDFRQAAVPRNDFARDMVTHVDTLRAAGNATNLTIAAAGKTSIFKVSPFLLSVKPGWNARDHDLPDNRRHVLQLAESIAAEGVKEPLTVHEENGEFYITNGHCRFLAVMHVINVIGVPINTVPIKFEDANATDADRIATQVMRNTGKELEPLELARVCKQLVSFGWEVKRIAALAGLTRGRIVQVLDLHARSTPKITQMIRTGEVKPTFAAKVLRAVANPSEADELLEAAVIIAKKAGKSKASEKHLPKPLGEIASTTPPQPLQPPAPLDLRPDPGTDAVAPAVSEASNSSAIATLPHPRITEPLAQPLKRIARDIFRRASIVEGEDRVIIQLSHEDYTKLREILGVPI
jgi:ParB-like chromosome segregation protein Spo0J